MTCKKSETTYANKGNDKIVIAQLTHNTSICPITCGKAKSFALSTKLANEHTHLLKLTGTCNNYWSFITLASLGAKGQNPHSRKKKRLSTLKDFRINPLTLLLMSSSTSTHTLDHQLRFQRRTTPPTIPTILLLFFLCNYVDNDNKYYIRKKTISWNDSCHCQTHQDYRRKRSRNGLPRE